MRLNRLYEATSSGTTTTPSTTITYGYDGDGNILSRDQTGGSPAFPQIDQSFNAADELCAQAATTPSCPGTATYNYDKDGSETAASDLANVFTALNYNAREQTTSITPAGSAAQSLSYQLDFRDLRRSPEQTVTGVARLSDWWALGVLVSKTRGGSALGGARRACRCSSRWPSAGTRGLGGGGC